MKTIIRQLLARKLLSAEECHTLFTQLEHSDELQQAVVFSLLAAKGEAFPEIMATRAFLLQQSTIDASCLKACPDNMIDLVGTGGDGSSTFNISTAASLVVASCGVYVAKHGGSRSTGICGSADVITALGIPTYQQASDIIRSLHQHYYAYLRAPYFNEFLNTMGSVRKQLDFPTIFNILGPLVNPLRPKRQVIGVYRKDLVPVVAAVLKETGSIHAMVLHAAEGLDELSVSGPTYLAEVRPEGIQEYVLCPQTLGFTSSTLQEVSGGTSEINAAIIQDVFSGKLAGAKRDIVVLNAAAGLLVADKVSSLMEGIAMAREAIISGKTLALLQRLQGEKA
ncbi:MAG: anthranilate phosphoribosyltransferase [Legionellaceae bacterium]|nr:anthranilate phosphoribosyltransferase [Legionellaceae bacterium]